ncbi:hypothetical protein GQ43DRAFT_248213 [Delitschia confertaspora ATCC 74209]|uniref:Rhodopsin domain-containing protein n=1 Tax=Delitschia confertaspora ATCC 74209 TaxID=1513339 RepID=A0A9P4MN06_9PLEO|nr:hypothetical protein GQ43DRAFT_248213 [Delitschia confertaspora ATCC 74209]
MFPVVFPRDTSTANEGPHLRNTTTTLLVLATFFVLLRFAARWRRGLSYGFDDGMVVLSLCFCYGAAGINYAMIHFGLGKHATQVSNHDLTIVLKLLVAFECVYCTGVGLVKLSLLLMYARIFPTKFFRISSYILGSITVGWVIAIIGVSIFQCNPIRKAWLPMIAGTCTNLKASFIGNAIPNILTDIAILLLPVREVWKLQVTPARRMSLWFMFGLGFFVLFASIYRFTTIMQFQPADTTWTLATACTWCVVEVASGIIGVCLPTLRPLLKLISNQFNDSRDSRGRSAKGLTTGSRPTELVTIGGTGGKRSNHDFNRLEDGMITVYPETDADSDKRSDSDWSGQLPLTNITVTKEVHQHWADNKGPSGR